MKASIDLGTPCERDLTGAPLYAVTLVTTDAVYLGSMRAEDFAAASLSDLARLACASGDTWLHSAN